MWESIPAGSVEREECYAVFESAILLGRKRHMVSNNY